MQRSSACKVICYKRIIDSRRLVIAVVSRLGQLTDVRSISAAHLKITTKNWKLLNCK